MNSTIEAGAADHAGGGPSATGALVVAAVDDDEIYRAFVAEILTRQGKLRVVEAASGAELLEILAGQPIDCVVLDQNLGAETGLSVGESIRGRFLDPPPIILLTGEGGERTAVKAFRGGFSDYLSKKNLSPNELIAAIRGAVSRHAQEQAQRAERDDLTRRVGRDTLTGLNAREYADAFLAELDGRAKERGLPYGLFLIRVDGFAQIQDRLGYVLGDRVLRVFAARLQRAAREVDTVARHDGTTFICIVDKEATPETMAALAKRLREQLVFDVNFGDVSVKLAPHLTQAIFPGDGRDPTALLAAAENALSAAETTAPAEAARDASGPSTTVITDRQTDRRRDRRQRVLKRAQIVLKGLGSTLDCVVRDISPGGALLRVNDYFSAPPQFELRFLDTNTSRQVEVRWQIGNDIGVRFL